MKPTVGRIVRYFPPVTPDGQPFSSEFPTPADGAAAIITHVWSDVTVNLSVFDSNGNPHPKTSVSQRTEANASYTWDWPERS